MTPKEFAFEVTTDSRFQALPYQQQLAIKANLLKTVERQDLDHRQLSQGERREFESDFMSEMPSSIREAIVRADMGQAGADEIYAIKKAQDAYQSRVTGDSGNSFADGVMDAAATAQSMMGRLGKVLVNGLVKLDTGNPDADIADMQFNSPLMRDTRAYEQVVNNYYNPGGNFDYKLGKGLIRGINGVSEFATMAGLYGSASPVGATGKQMTEGLLTQWIPRLFQASKLGVNKQTILRWGLQAATEAMGYVGEETLVDLVEGQFKDADYGETWLQDLPGNMGRGLAFFAMGEAMGGIIGKSIRGMAKGVTGLNIKQSTNYLNKLSTGELGDEMMKAISYGDTGKLKAVIDQVREFGGDDAVKDVLRLQSRIETFRVLGSEVTSDFAATKAMLTSEYGFEFKGKNIIHKIGDEVVDIKFKDQMDMMRVVRQEFADKANIDLTAGSKISADISSRLKVSVDVAGELKKITMEPVTLTKTFIPDSGLTDTGRVKTFVDQFDEGLTVRSVDNFDPNIRAKGEIVVPDKIDINTKEGVEAFSDSLQKQLDFNGIKIGTSNVDVTSYLKDLRYGSQWDQVAVEGLDSVSRVWAKADGTFTVQYKDKTVAKGTIEQVGELGHFKEQNIADINQRLIRDFGSGIREKGGKFQLVTDGKVRGEYDSMSDLWFDNQAMMPKRSFESAPQWVDMSGNAPRFTVGNVAKGDVKGVIKKLDSFENSWKGKEARGTVFTRKTPEGATVSVVPSERIYKVQLGDSGITKIFDNTKDMKKFLRQDVQGFEKLYTEYIDRFGLELRSLKTGGYQLFGQNPGLEGSVKYFKTLNDVKKWVGKQDAALSNVKNMSGRSDVEEISALRPHIPEFEGWTKEVTAWDAKVSQKVREGIGVEHFAANRIGSMNRLVEKLDIRELSQSYQPLVGRSAQFNAQANDLSNMLRARLKGFNRKEIMTMGRIVQQEISPEGWGAIAKKNFGIDTASASWREMSSAMHSVRDMLDDLGARFGIRAEDFIENYLPRIKNIELGDLRSHQLTDKNFIRSVMDPDNAAPLDPFFNHLRTEDLYSAKLSGDLESIVNIYMRIGLRKEFLGQALENFDTVGLKLLKDGKITPETHQRLKVFENSVAGRFVDDTTAKQYLNKMSRNHRWANRKGFGDVNKDFNDFTPKQIAHYEKILNADFTRGLSTFQTSALMTGKLWMPVRNSVQINHIGALYGNPRVIHSIDEIMTDPAKYWQKAHDAGLLQSRSQKDVKTFMAWLGNINRKGTNWFKNSDDMTRIVSMVSVHKEMDELLGMVSRQEINPQQFMKRSYASALDSGTQEQFAKLLAGGDVDAAKSLLTRNITDWSMFNYSKAQKPIEMNHTVTRTLLSYSTYPQQFAEMFGRMVKTNPLVAARLASNMYFLSLLYNDVFGLKGYEGNPLKAMMYLGGPMAAGGMDILRGTTQGISNVMRADTQLLTKVNSAGKVGWTAVKNGSRLVLPFNWYPKRFLEGVHALDQGEYYTSALQFAGLNVNREALLPQLSIQQLAEDFYDEDE